MTQRHSFAYNLDKGPVNMHVAPRTAFPGLLGLSLLAFSFAITSTADAQLHGREYSGVVINLTDNGLATLVK